MAFVDSKVHRAELLDVSVPLRVPFAISGGTMKRRRSLIVKLETVNGEQGFGEAAPFELPFYSSETFQSARACIEDVLIPRVVGAALSDPTTVRNVLADNVRGNRMARAAVETAWWDLQSRIQRVSLRTLVDDRLIELGLTSPSRTAPVLVCGAALGIPPGDDLDLLLAQVSDALALGFRRIKIKIRPDWSVRPLAAVLEHVRGRASDVRVSVDANAAFRLDEDHNELCALDDLDAVFVEQPFAEEDLWDTVVWSRQCTTPVCLDETLVNDEVARQVLEMGGPTIWNLKVQRMGGLEETCRVYVRGVRSGVNMWMGTMPETGLGAQCAIAFGGLGGLTYESDVGPSTWWFQPGSDLISVEMDENARVHVPREPGNTPKLDDAKRLAIWD